MSRQRAMTTLLLMLALVESTSQIGILIVHPICKRGARVLSFWRTGALLGLMRIGEIILLGDSPNEFIAIDALLRINVSVVIINKRLNIIGGKVVPSVTVRPPCRCRSCELRIIRSSGCLSCTRTSHVSFRASGLGQVLGFRAGRCLLGPAFRAGHSRVRGSQRSRD